VFPSPLLGGRRGRLVRRLHDEPAALALKPEIAVVSTAIQIAAPLVLRDEGHQGSEHVRSTMRVS
jgi:hypothetical protein